MLPRSSTPRSSRARSRRARQDGRCSGAAPRPCRPASCAVAAGSSKSGWWSSPTVAGAATSTSTLFNRIDRRARRDPRHAAARHHAARVLRSARHDLRLRARRGAPRGAAGHRASRGCEAALGFLSFQLSKLRLSSTYVDVFAEALLSAVKVAPARAPRRADRAASATARRPGRWSWCRTECCTGCRSRRCSTATPT